VSELFRRKIEGCFSEIANRIAACLEEARTKGDIAAESNTRRMASLLVDCWEGAALRSRLQGNARPLITVLDFYFQSAVSR
jgi:TetR/AcrR family transcriptional repressor of nem operon